MRTQFILFVLKKKIVRRGFIFLSAILLNLYFCIVFQEALKNTEVRINVNGRERIYGKQNMTLTVSTVVALNMNEK